MTTASRGQLPPRLLPVLYFGFAQISLACAFAVVAADPHGVAGFFYHSRMLAVVHLVTLGWITSSILGALYVVGPIALRAHFRAGWVDYAAAAFVAIGTIGMVAHFWIAEYSGMAWSGGMAGAGILAVGARIAGPLRHAPIPGAVKAHIALAFANIGAAAIVGLMLGINRVQPVFPAFGIAGVFAHAHLAAIGWAAMMVVGVAYRLLPMVLPAEMPQGTRLWTSAVLLEAGAVGLFVSMLAGQLTWAFALITVAGFGAFVAGVIRMVRHPRPRPPAIPSPDPAVLHAGAALVSLGAVCGIGVWLSIAERSAWTLRIATAYGVLGLVGFLAQMVVAMKGRLLPLFAWYWAWENAGRRGTVCSPHEMPWQAGRELTFVLWLFGVPVLAAGMAFDAVPFVRAAGWSLLAATVLDAAQMVLIVRHAWTRPARQRGVATGGGTASTRPWVKLSTR